jgi:hypothetical protein
VVVGQQHDEVAGGIVEHLFDATCMAAWCREWDSNPHALAGCRF